MRSVVLHSSAPLFFAVAVAGAGLLGCPTTPAGVEVQRDVVYALGWVGGEEGEAEWVQQPLLCDIYLPEEPGLRPALILAHGGSFTEGSKEKEEIVAFANYFADRGYVCFAINYRLTEDAPPAPSWWDKVNLFSAAHAAMVDVNAAVRFVRAHASEYGIDPGRIALLGESAGAIAGASAAFAGDDDYQSDGGDFPVPLENNPSTSSRVDAYCHFWGSADHVLLQVGPGDPPVMIVHGTDDDKPFVSFGASKRLHGLLELYDMPHEFYEAEDFGHGAWDYRNNFRNLRQLTFEFLEEYL